MSSVVYKTIFRCGIRCVIASWCVVVHGSQDRTFQSIAHPFSYHGFTGPMWGFELANYKTDTCCEIQQAM